MSPSPIIREADKRVLRMTRHEILAYEIHRSWWPALVSIGWMQSLAGTYFAWKARRISRRFDRHWVALARINAKSNFTITHHEHF